MYTTIELHVDMEAWTWTETASGVVWAPTEAGDLLDALRRQLASVLDAVDPSVDRIGDWGWEFTGQLDGWRSTWVLNPADVCCLTVSIGAGIFGWLRKARQRALLARLRAATCEALEGLALPWTSEGQAGRAGRHTRGFTPGG